MIDPVQKARLEQGLVTVRFAADQLVMLLREKFAEGMDEADVMMWIFSQLCHVGGYPDDAMTKTAAFLFVQLAKQQQACLD